MPEITLASDWIPFVGNDPRSGASLAGKGYARYAPVASTGLTDTPAAGSAIPDLARHALITVNTFPVRMRADGVAPTATEGRLVPAGTVIVIEGSHEWLRNLKFINTAAGAAEVTVEYFF